MKYKTMEAFDQIHTVLICPFCDAKTIDAFTEKAKEHYGNKGYFCLWCNMFFFEKNGVFYYQRIRKNKPCKKIHILTKKDIEKQKEKEREKGCFIDETTGTITPVKTYEEWFGKKTTIPDTKCKNCGKIFNEGYKSNHKYKICLDCDNEFCRWFRIYRHKHKNATKTKYTKTNIELFIKDQKKVKE